jgi:F-type H+-transporting ATPase subunit delta
MASVTNTYARAFADVVMAHRLDASAAQAEAQQIAQLTLESKELREVWDNPAIPAEQKRAVLDGIVQRAGISKPVRNFIAVVIDHGRTKLFQEIVAQLARELNQRLGFADAEITSVRELKPGERSAMEQDLQRVTGKKIRANYQQNKGLLGGVVVRVGSTVYDGSVKGQLERMRQELVGR